MRELSRLRGSRLGRARNSCWSVCGYYVQNGGNESEVAGIPLSSTTRRRRREMSHSESELPG